MIKTIANASKFQQKKSCQTLNKTFSNPLIPMKTSAAVLISLLPIASALHGTEPVRLNDENIAFAYEVKAEIPAPKEELAKIISVDYRNAPDEFSGRELFLKIEPVIEKRIAEAAGIPEWFVLIGSRLNEYDFDRQGFNTGFDDTTFIPFTRNGVQRYAVMFKNVADFKFLPVPIEKAKSLSDALKRSRKCDIQVEGRIVGAKEQTLNYSVYKVVELEITRLTIKLENGTLVGTMASQNSDTGDGL